MQCILPPSAEIYISNMNQILSCFCLKHTNCFNISVFGMCPSGSPSFLAVWVDVFHQLWKLLKALSLQIFTFAIFLSPLLLQLPLGMVRHFLLFHRTWVWAKGLALVWFQICLCSAAMPPAFWTLGDFTLLYSLVASFLSQWEFSLLSCLPFHALGGFLASILSCF